MKNAATDGIERDFPDWRVWLSEKGECWGAVRRRPVPDLIPTVIMDSEEELRAALAEELTCVEEGGRVEYPWSWGERVAGEDLPAKAAMVARVLGAGSAEVLRARHR